MPGFSLVERGQIVLPVQWHLKEGLSQLQMFQYFVAKKLRQGLSSDHFLIWKCWSFHSSIPDNKYKRDCYHFSVFNQQRNGWHGLMSTPMSLVLRVHANPMFSAKLQWASPKHQSCNHSPNLCQVETFQQFHNCHRIFDNFWLGRI